MNVYFFLVTPCSDCVNDNNYLCILQLGGSGLAVYWRNQPIPVDDKDDFKE